MDLFKYENQLKQLKKELKKNYEKQKKMGIVGGGREQFLKYTDQMLNNLDSLSEHKKDKNTLAIIQNQKARLKKYRNADFFFF
tara:strand:- start:196 stop:444 length:249 start_codon:yes stop_codon:yes gene_type:complete